MFYTRLESDAPAYDPDKPLYVDEPGLIETLDMSRRSGREDVVAAEIAFLSVVGSYTLGEVGVDDLIGSASALAPDDAPRIQPGGTLASGILADILRQSDA